MSLSVIVKDFLWWLIKENRLVNAAYLSWGKRAFPKINHLGFPKDTPTTEKDDYFHAKPKSFPAIKGYTSGTTNKPLTVYRSIKSILLEEYMIKSVLKQYNVPLRPRIAVLRGDHISDSDNTDKFSMKLPFTGRLILSSFHLGPETVDAYFAKLEQHKPDLIMAYPSSISLLAQLAEQRQWRPNWPISCVLTSSETFKQDKQALVRKIFGNVCDHYGQAERIAALQTCKEGKYHVREDYSLVEFIQDEYGFKIVGSNVYNKAMPMVRYDTGDYVSGIELSKPCACGLTSPYVEEILGRDDDYIILEDGRQIGRMDVAFKGIDDLVEAQLEQATLNKVIVRYVAYPNVEHKTLTQVIENSLRERLGSSIQYDFIALTELPRTQRGKFKSVIRNPDIG